MMIGTDDAVIEAQKLLYDYLIIFTFILKLVDLWSSGINLSI